MKYPLVLWMIYVFLSGSIIPVGPDNILAGVGQKSTDTLVVDSLLTRFYSVWGAKPVWFDSQNNLNTCGKELLGFIRTVRNYGLEPENYFLSEVDSLIAGGLSPGLSVDKKLTEAYFLLARHLCCGQVEDISPFTTLKRKVVQIDYVELLRQAIQNNQITTTLLDVQPVHQEYRKLQKALAAWLSKVTLTDKKINVIANPNDSVTTYRLGKSALKLHGYIAENVSDSVFISALKRFQYEHGLLPDGIIGKKTAAALRKSPMDYYKQAVLSLERWRWKSAWGETFLYVNIPAFLLKYYKKNRLQYVLKVVVGTPKRRTPEVYSKLEYMVVFPYWNVPRSISVGEILPHAKEDPAYLVRNRYEIFNRHLKPVDPFSVNWDTINSKNFNFYIRQKGGRLNALSMVKLIFPNKYTVYLHDTPFKKLFEKDFRARSHGCVRVQQAVKLAGDLLNDDDNIYNKDSIATIIKRKIETKIPLNDKVPVYIQYITCDTDQKGSLIFYPDIYRKDEMLKRRLFSGQKAH